MLHSVNLSLASVLALLVAPSRAVNENRGQFEIFRTLPISDEEVHSSCRLFSDQELTLLKCRDSFEVYETSDFQQGSSLIHSFALDVPIIGVQNSLVSSGNGELTFLYKHQLEGYSLRQVKRAPLTKEIEVEELMSIPVPQE